jgi:polyvinyl alcohol dehydrogenase (cytochrome)
MAWKHTNRRTRRGSLLLTALAVALLGALTVAPASQADWPQDGHDIFNLRLNKSEGPTASRAPTLSKVWQKSFDGDITGTPVVLNNKFLYVGTHNAVVTAVARDNGFTLWSRFVGGAVPGSVLHFNNTIYANVSRVGAPRLVALDPLTGDTKFSTIVDTQADSDAWASPNYSAEHNLIYVASGASKAEDDRKVGVRTRGSVTAVDATSGAVVWKTFLVPSGRNGAGVRGTPLVIPAYKRLYVATDHAYSGTAHPTTDAIVGLELYDEDGDSILGEVVGSHQIKADDVAENSSLDLTKRVGFTVAPNVVAPIGGIYPVTAGAGDGRVYAVNPLTFERMWEQPVGVGSSNGGVVGSGAWDGARIHGTTTVPTAFWGLRGTGAIAYAFPGTDPLHYGAVSIGRGVGFSADSAGFLDSFDPATGRVLGRAPLGLPSIGGVSVATDKVFAAVGTGRGTGGAVAAFR